ncbi:SigB/SigF/SigG family RNA polymerase sigma factor [Kitasatospora sp. NPDC051853]|uniref:SigB/SigF/SigG family RNA polymerase sigma factor n=1 Tax=Kitasatospora sp. NPDC051853 TaxID=3364058 RepID=UPI0037AEED42
MAPDTIVNPSAVSTGDARELSRELFRRLAEAEPGSETYSYVRGTLIELNMSLVRFAARRFRSSHEPMEDIVQTGMVGLIKAIDRFDPDRNVEFTTFALPTVLGEMRRFFRDTTWAVHVPRSLQEARLAVAQATDELEQTLGRLPDNAELAERTGLTEQGVADGIAVAVARTAGSLDAHTPGEDEEDCPGPLDRRLGHEDPSFVTVDDIQSLKPLISALPERERAVLALRFTGDLTQAEIGRRLGLSQMHVSRLLSRTLTDLRTALDG